MTRGPYKSCRREGITVYTEKFPYKDGIYMKKYRTRYNVLIGFPSFGGGNAGRLYYIYPPFAPPP